MTTGARQLRASSVSIASYRRLRGCRGSQSGSTFASRRPTGSGIMLHPTRALRRYWGTARALSIRPRWRAAEVRNLTQNRTGN